MSVMIAARLEERNKNGRNCGIVASFKAYQQVTDVMEFLNETLRVSNNDSVILSFDDRIDLPIPEEPEGWELRVEDHRFIFNHK